jgi:hypothetical protein
LTLALRFVAMVMGLLLRTSVLSGCIPLRKAFSPHSLDRLHRGFPVSQDLNRNLFAKPVVTKILESVTSRFDKLLKGAMFVLLPARIIEILIENYERTWAKLGSKISKNCLGRRIEVAIDVQKC